MQVTSPDNLDAALCDMLATEGSVLRDLRVVSTRTVSRCSSGRGAQPNDFYVKLWLDLFSTSSKIRR